MKVACYSYKFLTLLLLGLTSMKEDEMKIRKAIIEDASGISRVHVDAWRTTYKNLIPDSFLDQLSYEEREQMWKVNIPNGNVYVAENTKGKIVGFACGGKERSGEFAGYDGELYAIYILEKYQGQGIGRKLTEAVKHHLREIGLTSMVILVLEGNKAYRFYEALGGKKIGILEDTIADKVVNELVYGWAEI